ncbi:MAG: alanine/ornithine racemase family PLP-dependent enzyme, partial [Gammaproteobacteria bacterium]|nr:alanine/ornithine racemase family PLP-dependent enzyme [Gammaproteobacteria bacterium]
MINYLHMGDALQLGCETLQHQAIPGLYSDAFTLVAEVIESKVKPAQPWGELAQTALDTAPSPSKKQGLMTQSIPAIGLQDTDTAGLLAPEGMEIPGTSSDHLIIDAGRQLAVG